MDLTRLFEKKPDHPMASVEGAREVLAPLAREEPLEAMDQFTHWAGSLRDTDGFACDDRMAALKELDECARPRVAALFAEYFGRVHVRDREQKKLFSVLYDYWSNLSGAYARVVADDEHRERGAERMHDDLALALARSFRAAGEAARMRCLRYLPIRKEIWPGLYRQYLFAEVAHIEETPVRLYEHEARSTPRAELLRVLGLSLADTDGLPLEQVELSWRILGRFAISFEWSRDAQAGNFVVDLAAGGPPTDRRAKEPPAPSKRYLAGGKALAKLADIEHLSEADLLSDEARYGKEFSPAQIVSAIRHLALYLGPNPPKRSYARTPANVQVSVLHGFKAICQRVGAIEIGAELGLEAEKLVAEPETWLEKDRSDWGMRIEPGRGAGLWAEPGVVCAILEKKDAPWQAAIIRRLDTDEAGRTVCGVQVLSKKPVSVWLRMIGVAEKSVTWETTGKFSYDYARAIVLPDAVTYHGHSVILLTPKDFVAGQVCEIMAGSSSRTIKMLEFIEQGADYVRASFSWAADPAKKAAATGPVKKAVATEPAKKAG